MGDGVLRTLQRGVALFSAPGYLVLMAILLHGYQPSISKPLAITVVFIGAAVIMAVFYAIRVHLSKVAPGQAKFTLATLFWLSIPLCIYFSYIRVVWLGLGSSVSNSGNLVGDLGVVGLSGLIFMIVSSAILLAFTESLIWLLAKIRGLVVGED